MDVLFYLILISTLINCNLFKINAQKSCKSCLGSNEFCFNNGCKCGPNYRLNRTLHNCEHFDCSEDTECQEYDENRKCLNQECICFKGFTENRDTKICQKPPKDCSHNSDCQSYGNTNEVCVDNKCECLPNYKWDLTHERCIHFYCNSDNDCKDYDQNRICHNSKCICSTNFVVDYDNKKCVEMKSCTNLNDCDQNQFCINNQFCRCQPNYRYSAETMKCEYHSCDSDNDCNQFDRNSECSFDSCKCRSGYVLDPKTKICNKTIGMYCSTNYDCVKYEDNNQICVDNKCYCKPNYKLDTDSSYCSYYSCSYDSECQTYDNHRMCNSMGCKCDTDYKEDSFSLKCIYNASDELNNNERIWMILFIIALVLLFISGVGIYYYVVKKRKTDSLQESNIRFDCNPPIIQQNPNLSMISHNVAIDDPPPPYSTVE